MKNFLLVLFLVFGCSAEDDSEQCALTVAQDCVESSYKACQDCTYYKSCYPFQDECQKELLCDSVIQPPCFECYTVQTYSCQ